MPSKLQGKPGEPFNSQCQCPARSKTRPENLFAYDRLPLGQRACRAVARKAGEGWWSQTGSNRRPHACKARALPTELWPLMKPRPTWEPRLGASSTCSPEGSMVGPGRLELPTSRLSGVCSNHLSYRPLKRHVQATHRIQARTRDRTTTSNGCGVMRKEKRRRRRLACLYMSMTNQ